MAVALYRKGTAYVFHGLEVDFITVETEEVSEYRRDGWFLSPAAAYEEKPKRRKPKTED